ncbi:MAG: immunoglobulin-like domain-containing protein [Chitinophagales bacterium]
MKKNLLAGIFTALAFSLFAQMQIGRTTYDLQTNNSNCRRMAIDPSGKIVATYTRSYEFSSSFNDRGTGYNYSDDNGATWQTSTFPGTFSRPDTGRTGWPNPVFTNNKEVIISHFAASAGAPAHETGLQVLRRDIGSTGAWEKLILNSANATNTANNAYANDATWARAASNGDSIFVIFGLIDTDMPGMTGGLQMYRSIDAGATWEGPNDIPMMNSTNFVASGGDNYALDINSNGKIAIVLGSYQVEVLTSTDWGATFSKQTVVAINDINGVPAPLFDALTGETMDTVDATDRSYSILVDDNDMVHVWFGRTRSFKTESTTTGATYLPLSVGLVYWNDLMAEAKVVHESRLAAQQVGLPNPLFTGQVFSASGFGPQVDLYRASLTSMPSSSYDDNGNIYVSYSAMVPGTFDDITDLTTTNNVSNDAFHYRDIYVLKSADNGATWEGPINVSNAPLKECAYPSIPRKIYGTDIPVMWQEDTIPGVNLQEAQGASHPVTENQIMFVNTPVASIVSPTDITAPTISEKEQGVNVVDAFLNCDVNFALIFENDDVPTGPNVLDYEIVDATALTGVGTHSIDVYVLDANGNSSDTIEALVTVAVDNVDPIVTLIGPDTVDLLNGSSYTDPGIDYSDNACYPSATPLISTDLDENTDGTYTYTWNVTDNSGNTTSVSRTVNVIGTDNVAPVITPNGLATETIEACSVWTDAGVTAFDNIDYDVTANVTSTGTVNENAPGTYTREYSVTDAAGNIGTFTRTVIVEDNTAPEIAMSATATVYVCKNGTFTAPGATATDCVDLNVTLSNDGNVVVNTAVNGLYVVTYTAEDDYNNISTETINVEVGEAPVPDFNFISSAGSQVVIVQDASTGSPNSWQWNWNDPNNTNSSFGSSATHPYASAGSYDVELIIDNNFTSSCQTPASALSVTKTVEVTVGIVEVNKLNAAVNVFPNPSNGIINVNIDDNKLNNVEVSLFNVIGELISTEILENTAVNNNVTFNLGNDAAGMYFVNISTEKATISKKVLVK